MRVLMTGASSNLAESVFARHPELRKIITSVGRKTPVGTRHLRCDLLRWEDVQRTSEIISSEHYDVVALLAGVDSQLSCGMLIPEACYRAFQINCVSQLNLLGALTNRRQRGSLKVVCASTSLLTQPEQKSCLYVMTKAAIEQGLRSLFVDCSGLFPLEISLARIPFIGTAMKERAEECAHSFRPVTNQVSETISDRMYCEIFAATVVDKNKAQVKVVDFD